MSGWEARDAPRLQQMQPKEQPSSRRDSFWMRRPHSLSGQGASIGCVTCSSSQWRRPGCHFKRLSRSAHQSTGNKSLLLDGSHSTAFVVAGAQGNGSPTERGALALSCDLLRLAFQSEIKCSVLLCFILEELFQGPAASSINRTLHRAEIYAEQLEDAVTFNLQGALPSARRNRRRYVTAAQNFSRNVPGHTAPETCGCCPVSTHAAAGEEAPESLEKDTRAACRGADVEEALTGRPEVGSGSGTHPGKGTSHNRQRSRKLGLGRGQARKSCLRCTCCRSDPSAMRARRGQVSPGALAGCAARCRNATWTGTVAITAMGCLVCVWRDPSGRDAFLSITRAAGSMKRCRRPPTGMGGLGNWLAVVRESGASARGAYIIIIL
jgi:hypothetical protein